MKLKFMMKAKQCAQEASDDICKSVGAVIVYKNRIIGHGFNRRHKTHPKSNTPFYTIHAEHAALLQTRFTEGATIYVFRQTANGKPAMARPCKCCMQMLKDAGIKKICYSIDNGYNEEKVA